MIDFKLISDALDQHCETEQTELAIHRMMNMYRIMVENTIDLIIRYDCDRRRVYVSPVCIEMVGYTPKQMLGKKGYDRNHPDDRGRLIAVFNSIGPSHCRDKATFRVRRKDGVYIWVETSFRYMPEDGSVLTVSRDVTDRKHAEETLAEAHRLMEATNQLLSIQARQDGLTGLVNRRYLDEMLDIEFLRARREKQALAVVMIDVDCFKSYNDTYGHLAGDECLRRISHAIKSVLQRPADLAARYGGEEIVVLLPWTDHSGAMCIAETIRQTVAALGIEHSGNPFGCVTISAGVNVLAPPTEFDFTVDLIRTADRALYIAKSEGRNCVRSASHGCVSRCTTPMDEMALI